MQRVVLHAHAAAENLGDRLIVEAIRSSLRTALPGHELVFEDASPGTGSSPLSLSPPLPSRTRRAIEEADLVLLGGGELVGPFPEYLGAALAAAAASVPAVWLGVGGHVTGGRVDRFYTRLVLRCAEAVVTRGPQSFERLSADVAGARIFDGVDVAFGWQPPHTEPCEQRDEFGICLRGPERRDRLWDRAAFERLAREIDVLAARGLRPVFFTFLSDRDAARIGSPNLAGSFGSDAEVHDFVWSRMRSEPAEELVAEGDLARVSRRVQSLRFLMGMRLHSLILAAHCRVPFLALDYAPKIAELVELLGASEWLVRPEEVGTRLPQLAARLCDPAVRGAFARDLEVAVAGLRQRAVAQLAPVLPILAAPRRRTRRLGQRAAARVWLRAAALHARL